MSSRDFDSDEDNTAQPLITIRIIWGAILMGLIFISAVMVVLTLDQSPEEATPALDSDGLPVVTIAAAGLLIAAVPAAYFLRNQIYKKHWSGDAVEPEGYVTANILFLALIEAPAVVAAIGIVVHGSVFPQVIPLVIAAGIILANFPTGGPMRSQAPRLGVSER
ncbi:MAG: hypothetical protein AAF593_03125 [Planctomycetota bacterium]